MFITALLLSNAVQAESPPVISIPHEPVEQVMLPNGCRHGWLMMGPGDVWYTYVLFKLRDQ